MCAMDEVLTVRIFIGVIGVVIGLLAGYGIAIFMPEKKSKTLTLDDRYIASEFAEFNYRLDYIESGCKKMNQDMQAISDETEHLPKTANCDICKKTDFKSNLANIDWMEDWTYFHGRFAHPECAKIKRSDDGKGWVRIKK